MFNLNDGQVIHMYRSPGYKNGLTSVHIDMELSSIPVQYVVYYSSCHMICCL